MSKKRKILYILIVVVMILIFNSSKVLAAFPTTLLDFSERKNEELMSDSFLEEAINHIGYRFSYKGYVQGFKNRTSSSHAWCLNERSGNILKYGTTQERMLLAIMNVAPKDVKDCTKATVYSYVAPGKPILTKTTNPNSNIAAITYLGYLASYYYKGDHDQYFESFKNNAGKKWVQDAWWYGYKKGFSSALKSAMSPASAAAFESSRSKSYRDGKEVEYVAYKAALEYANFCEQLVNNKGIAISSEKDTIEKTKKTENGILVGPIKLTRLVKDNVNNYTTSAQNGSYKAYTWTPNKSSNKKAMSIGEGTQNKINVTIIFRKETNRNPEKFTYNILNGATENSKFDIKICDENGNNEKNLGEMTFKKNFYLYIKDKSIKYGDIEKIEIQNSYKLYNGRLYMFDSCGSSGEDQGIASGDIAAGSDKHANDTIILKINDKFDLSLRKALVKIDRKDGTVDNREKEERGLSVSDITKLKNGESYTAVYNKKKGAVDVEVGDKITYEIRVYNEGIINGYAKKITEYIPEGLKLAENSKTNQTYNWKDTGRTTTINGIKHKIYETRYLENSVIKAYNGGNSLDFKKVYIECEVDTVGGGFLYNLASITESIDVDGNDYDRDSTPEEIWKIIENGKYDIKDDTSTYLEDDDDYESVFKLIDIGGKVFIDGHRTKEQEKEINGLYDSGETLVEGVPVRLYDGNGNIIGEQKTDKNGQYKFKKIRSDKEYFVRFYYNGVNFKSTIYTHNGNNDETRDSDAEENPKKRTELNNRFSEISFEFLNTDESKRKTIEADTRTYNGKISTHTWENLNLGIYERTKADLSLFDNVLETKVEVNGKTQIYRYNEVDKAKVDLRYNTLEQCTQNIYKSDIENGRETFKFYITYRIKVKNESNVKSTAKEIVNYYDPRYEFKEVKAKTAKGEDIKAEKKDTTKYFGLTNNAKISNPNIDDKYYTENGYKALYIDLIDDKYIGNGEEIWIDITYELKDAADTLYKELKNADSTKAINYSEIKGFKTTEGVLEDDSIPGNYIINPDKIEEQSKIGDDDYNKSPVFMFKYVDPRTLEGNVWEAIANDVKEGANLYGNDKLLTYIQENGIKGIKVELIELKDGKQEVKAEARTGENGSYKFEGFIPGDYVLRFTYGEKDNVIKSNKTTYKYDGTDYNAIFNGQNYQSTKANPNENSHQYWYAQETEKRYSDAYDDAETRMKQINSLTQFSYEQARKLLDQSEQNENNTINAFTGKMELEIEYATTETIGNEDHEYKVINVDFGLTPRTETKIKLEKEITHVKLILNDGTVQIDADVVKKGNTKVLQGEKIGKIKYLPKGTNSNKEGVNIELDDEITQGAIIQITYNVKATNETAKEEYKLYKNGNNEIIAVSYYGEEAEKLPAYEGENKVINYKGTTDYSVETIEQSKTENRPNKVGIVQLVDHSTTLSLSEKVEENKKWKKDLQTTKSRNDDKNDPKINDESHDIRGEITCVQLDTGKIELAHGESKEQKIAMEAKIPQNAVTDIDLNYSNYATITELTTNVGRVTSLIDIEVESGELEITPPTGQRVIYYIISGAAIIIFAIGTVLIKKYALKKKEE